VSACRGCGDVLTDVVIDLGVLPLANAYVDPARADAQDPTHPLLVLVCAACLLVQLDSAPTREELFTDYPYFSSYSMLDHAAAYASMIGRRLGLAPGARVVEVGSNDGYLLTSLRDAGYDVLGIDPALNVVDVAREKGVETRAAFFDEAFAASLAGDADLIIANNVMAHVPNPASFVEGLRVALAPAGTVTIEFSHLLHMLAETQFDSIYHEHISYFSLLAAQRLLAEHGLEVVDVEQIPTHGGSLRLYVQHAGAGTPSNRVTKVLAAEHDAGLDRLDTYAAFPAAVHRCQRALRELLAASAEC
jgi:SAM-dependent methyltransferase